MSECELTKRNALDEQWCKYAECFHVELTYRYGVYTSRSCTCNQGEPPRGLENRNKSVSEENETLFQRRRKRNRRS